MQYFYKKNNELNKTIMKKRGLLIFISLIYFNINAQIYTSTNVLYELKSTTSIEVFQARAEDGEAAFNSSTGKLAFKGNVKSLKFSNALMQEQFNEDYMESDKYPQLSFVGEVDNMPDFTKDGEYTLKAKGVFSIHGIERTKDVNVNFVIENGKLKVYASFQLRPREFNIQIPNIVIEKIAEEIEIIINTDLISKN
jgi:polyisoprenoid-binding protein YceI